MAELKTQKTDVRVDDFLRSIDDPKRRADCEVIMALMRTCTKAEPRMWGPAIVGFGDYHYVYESGREGDWYLVGFSPRKQNLTIYLTTGFVAAPELLAKLGKFTSGKSCLYIKKIEDIHLPTLKKLLTASIASMKKKKA